MPPNARVLIFQDVKVATEMASEFLRMAGHTVVGTAQTMDELNELLKSKRIKPVDVALIDNSTPWSDGDDPDVVGPQAAEWIKKALPDAVQVAWTKTENPGYGAYQYNSDQHQGNSELGTFVTALPSGSKEIR